MTTPRFAISSVEHLRGRVGRPRSNLLNTIQNDLKEHSIELKNIDDLENLKFKAHDRVAWKNMFTYSVSQCVLHIFVILQDLLTL